MTQEISKVLIIGSGPIVIGQAAEFDYAGTQACKSLREEGIEVVLVNSNPATIMTDLDVADKVYIEPLIPEIIEKIIIEENPDAWKPGLVLWYLQELQAASVIKEAIDADRDGN